MLQELQGHKDTLGFTAFWRNSGTFLTPVLTYRFEALIKGPGPTLPAADKERLVGLSDLRLRGNPTEPIVHLPEGVHVPGEHQDAGGLLVEAVNQLQKTRVT